MLFLHNHCSSYLMGIHPILSFPARTHESQPLDCGVFGPLKKQWTDVCHDFQQQNRGVVINKYNFSRLFYQAWMQAFTVHNIVAGFQKCGVHSFDHSAIEILDDDTANESGFDLNSSHNDSTSVKMCVLSLEFQFDHFIKQLKSVLNISPSQSKMFCYFSKHLKRL